MNKEYIKYFHYYLGCPIVYTSLKKEENQYDILTTKTYQQLFYGNPDRINFIKIFLKKVEDISDKDFTSLTDLLSKKLDFNSIEEFNEKIYEDANAFLFLIENQYDVFGLIKKGIAEDQNNQIYRNLIRWE